MVRCKYCDHVHIGFDQCAQFRDTDGELLDNKCSCSIAVRECSSCDRLMMTYLRFGGQPICEDCALP